MNEKVNIIAVGHFVYIERSSNSSIVINVKINIKWKCFLWIWTSPFILIRLWNIPSHRSYESVSFVKHELKGVCKFKGRKFGPSIQPPDILVTKHHRRDRRHKPWETLLIEVTTTISYFTF
jgi:hypothetical protein